MRKMLLNTATTVVAVLAGMHHTYAEVGTAFTYQGQLKQAGIPVNDTCDFKFSLWDAMSGGNMISSELVFDGQDTYPPIEVVAGLFTVELDFGDDAFDGQERALEIAVSCPSCVDGPGPGPDPLLDCPTYAVLSPRQNVTATPYALNTRGISVNSQHNVGIGLSAQPGQRLYVSGTTDHEAAIRGESPVRGLLGFATGDGTGVVGYAENQGHGVFGEAYGNGAGIFGSARASSGINYGVRAYTDSLDGYAGYFEGRSFFSDRVGIGTESPEAMLHVASLGSAILLQPTQMSFNETTAIQFSDPDGGTTPMTIQYQDDGSPDLTILGGNVGIGTTNPTNQLDVRGGVSAYNMEEGGTAVFGEASATSGDTTGIYGITRGSRGIAVRGSDASDSSSGIGVYGSTTKGVALFGDAAGSTGHNFGVLARSYSPDGKGVVGVNHSPSGTTDGVRGESESTEGTGVRGQASASTGITYGVYGSTNSPSGYGVYSLGAFAATGTKAFQIDHPLDPANRFLNHYCAEGPEPTNTYSGNILLDGVGEAWVQLPAYFEAINRDFRYQITCIGTASQVYIAQEIANNRFRIAGGAPGAKVSWLVIATRNDAWMRIHGATVETDKPQSQKGKYLHPELFGQPDTERIFFHPKIPTVVVPASINVMELPKGTMDE